MKFTSLKIIFISIFLLNLSFANFLIPQSQAQGPVMQLAGTPLVELMHNGKVVHTSQTFQQPYDVKVDKLQEYSIRASILPVSRSQNPTQHWQGQAYIFDNNTFTGRNFTLLSKTAITKSGVTEWTNQFAAGSAAGNTLYTYRFEWSGDNFVNKKSSEMKINFVNASGTNTGGSTQTGTTCKYTGTPLTKDALIKAVKDKKPTTNQLSATIKKSGVDFSVSTEVEKELTTAKVPATLIKLAKDNPKSSCDTQGSTNTNTTVTGNPNENINTDVSSKFDKGLDEKIGDFWNPLERDTLPELLATILRILFALIGMVAVIIIIISGFRMVLASGNETELTKAKAAITWAIVGLIVSLMAFSIVAIVQRLIQTNVVI